MQIEEKKDGKFNGNMQLAYEVNNVQAGKLKILENRAIFVVSSCFLSIKQNCDIMEQFRYRIRFSKYIKMLWSNLRIKK